MFEAQQGQEGSDCVGACPREEGAALATASGVERASPSAVSRGTNNRRRGHVAMGKAAFLAEG